MIDIRSFPLELLAVLLYAETHYRFRYFFSFLKKSEPELIADAPLRVEPGSPIPLLLLAKDAHRYPATLVRISATVRALGMPERSVSIVKKPVRLSSPWWWRVVDLETKGLDGWVEIDVCFDIEGPSGHRRYHNDNHRTSSRRPLRVYVSPHPIPRLGPMHFGDLHTHSTYTSDQVEFGSPPEASVRLSRALGLSFFAVTDHSYDLDDCIDDYLKNDPEHPKWNALQKELDALNKKTKRFVTIRGEEVSSRNGSGHNVHLLLLGLRDFVPGSGDGAERWLRTRSEFSVREIVSKQPEGVLKFAAHPLEDVPFLQRLLLSRGSWKEDDLMSDVLTGIQFANGSHRGFRRGLLSWVQSLLRGQRLIAIAGNDAHGNFNRFRQIRIPFLSIGESEDHRFGGMRTGILLSGKLTERMVLAALGAGRCLITDGPVAVLTARSGRQRAELGGTLSADDVTIELRALSTPEFGAWSGVKVIAGVIGDKSETVLFERQNISGFDIGEELHWRPTRPSYIRFEGWTSLENTFDRRSHFCITNPIWVHPTS